MTKEQMQEIIDKMGALASELEKLRVYRVVGYISETDFSSKYSKLLEYEEELVEEYDETTLYSIIREIENYYDTKEVSGNNFISGSVKRLKENLYEYIVLSEDLSLEETDIRQKKINGIMDKISRLSKGDFDAKDLLQEVLTKFSCGDLREFLEVLHTENIGRSSSPDVREFVDGVKALNIIDMSIEEYFNGRVTSSKERLDEDTLKKVALEALNLSTKRDYFASCSEMGESFKTAYSKAQTRLNEFSNGLIRMYDIDDLYRIVEEIDGYASIDDKRRVVNGVSDSLKNHIYSIIKDNVIVKDEEVDSSLVGDFVLSSTTIASDYTRAGTLSSTDNKRFLSIVDGQTTGLVNRIFNECNPREVDEIIDTFYEQCRDNKFRHLSGVQYVIGRINDEKRDRFLKEYFSGMERKSQK